ncbi:MAG: ParB/RepB/Spo0J family partition protein [Pseudomonadota bacterium]
MAKKSDSRGLGRGLSSLLGEEVRVNPADNVTALQPKRGETGLKELPLDLLMPNPDQPRTHFEPEQIEELSKSIKDRGVLQPILARPMKNDPGLYEIVAGERRWRAAQKAQLHKVPVIIQELSDKATFEIALIENVQRSDLNPMEEARAYRKLSEDFGHSADAIGGLVGKSRSHVANLMRLLALPDDVAAFVENGSLSMGHARALLTAPAPFEIAQKILSDGLSVRETEALVNARQTSGKSGARSKSKSDPETASLARDISQALGLNVTIAHKGKSGGTISVKYGSLDQLDEVCRRLANAKPGPSPF